MSAILEGNSSTIEGQLGWKGERGYSAYELAVQHGYIGTESEWLASKNEKWQDEGGVDVKFFKGDTDDLEDRPIANGQLLYNVDTGETYLDYVQDRIPMGSGNVVAVSDTEPTNPATKLWINPDEPLNNIGTEVVNSMSGNETNMAPSVSAVKDYTKIETINLLEANDNGTIVKQKFFKQGKHIWGDAVISNSVAFTGTYQYPCKLIYDYPSGSASDLYCVLCYGEFTAEGIGYMYITPNQKNIMISDTTGGNDKQYAKIHLDFVLN